MRNTFLRWMSAIEIADDIKCIDVTKLVRRLRVTTYLQRLSPEQRKFDVFKK